MAIRAGQFLHDAQGFVVDRIQTGGVSNLNIPKEVVKELGDYQTVAVVRDVPDLTFSIDSVDVSCQMEAINNGLDPTAVVSGQVFDPRLALPLDVLSPFKSTNGAFNVVKGLVVPYLSLESIKYSFGIKADAKETYSYRGDSIYYVPGVPYYETFTGDGATTVFGLTHGPATVYQEPGDPVVQHVLSVCLINPDGTWQRLFHNFDWTDSTTAVTLATAPATGVKIKVTYGSLVAKTYAQSVNASAAVKPAAVRSRDIDIYVGNTAATPTFTRLGGVQNFDVTWKVTLDKDEEFGNAHYVAQDYDVPDVSGSIDIKSASVATLWSVIAQLTNVDPTQVIGANSSVPLPVELHVNHPDTGVRLKTLYVPDARFEPPPMEGKVGQKVAPKFGFQSDTGQLYTYNGQRPGGVSAF